MKSTLSASAEIRRLGDIRGKREKEQEQEKGKRGKEERCEGRCLRRSNLARQINLRYVCLESLDLDLSRSDSAVVERSFSMLR